MEWLREFAQRILSQRTYRVLLAPYHFAWNFFSALYYGFPAKKLVVIGVTGTKGKSSVSEMLYSILTEAGHTVALSSTIHFAIGRETKPNLFKMTLPGRGFIHAFLHEAYGKGATHAIIEITSESTLQYRHLFLSLDALIFTNLEKEHLERHGGMQNYFLAKYEIGKALVRSSKRPRAIIANNESSYGARFLALPVEKHIPFAIGDAQNLTPRETGIKFTYGDVTFDLPHPGEFSARNALAAIKTAEFLGVPLSVSARALSTLTHIAGRAERIEAGQDFLAVVDYAHTPDSLEALYKAYGDRRKICVLGNTGGGRDSWKRPLMGQIAERYCDEVILTDEDPYNEDPLAIVSAMASGMTKKPRIIMERRQAIAEALSQARTGDVVLVTGKGTDPYIMRAHGAKEVWSDAQVVREELEKRTS
jgi:UDP-N-acetylmuramoyl-L-alanyl-D-glutamate--2,6-diaminopimelate ligase